MSAPVCKFVWEIEGLSFHIEVNGVHSSSTGYTGIARVQVGQQLYIGATEYFQGVLPTEVVLAVIPVVTEKVHWDLTEETTKFKTERKGE